MSRLSVPFLLGVVLLVAAACQPAFVPAQPAPSAGSEPPAEQPAPDAPNVACVVHVGPITDNGWTQAHHEGLVAATEQVGWELREIESILAPTDVERVTRDYAQSGDCAVIVGTAQNFDPDMRRVAREFPDIPFLILHGAGTEENIGVYFGRMYIPRYLSGILAGSMTESKVIGFVGAFENNPQVARGRDAFIAGVKEVCPDCEVKVVYTNNWFDPPAEGEAAQALIDSGADVLAQHQDSDTVQQRAAEAGILGVGYDADMRKTAGDSVLTSPIWQWVEYYAPQFEAIKDGTWQPEWYWSPNVTRLASFSPKVPLELYGLVAQYEDAIAAGSVRIFDMPDEELWGYGAAE